MNKLNKYSCNICGKEYKHRQSLRNHIKLKHPEKDTTFPTFSNPKDILKTPHETPQNILPTSLNDKTTSIIKCKYCNQQFAFNQGKYRHQKKCKYNTDVNYISKEDYLKELQKIKEKQVEELQKLKEELTSQFMKMIKEEYHPKTQNIGNQLNDHAIGTQNNIIIQLGKEDVLGTITQKEKLKILNERYKSVLELVKLMHCSGKYPQFNNSIISNLKSEFALTYDENEDQFVTTKKNELVSDIVSHRTADVEEILEENKEKVSKQTNKKVKELIELLEKDDIILTQEDTDFIKNYNTEIITKIYDKRKELKKQLKTKIQEIK